MKFGILSMLLLVAWVSLTLAMLFSESLMFHDLYAIAGKLLLLCMMCQAVFTAGRAREFWIVFSVVALFFVVNRDLLHVATYWSDYLVDMDSNGGGVMFEDYGADKMYPESVEEGKIRGSMWWNAKRSNGPLVLGLLMACIAVYRNVWKWRILGVIWLGCIVCWAITHNFALMHILKLMVTLVLVLSCLIPLSANVKNRRFWIVYAIGCGVWLQVSLTGNRNVVRPTMIALHKLFEFASIPDSPGGNSDKIAHMLVYVLAPVIGLAIAAMATWFPSPTESGEQGQEQESIETNHVERHPLP